MSYAPKSLLLYHSPSLPFLQTQHCQEVQVFEECEISKGFYSLKGSVIRFIRCKTTVPLTRAHAPVVFPLLLRVQLGEREAEENRGKARYCETSSPSI